MKEGRIKKAESIFEEFGPVVRATVLRDKKFCSKDIAELVTGGYLYKIRTGYYVWNATIIELSEIELVSLLVPQGVIALFSAAQYHNMTTVNPVAIDLALPAEMRTPVLPDHPPITIYKFVRNVYKIGIEEIAMPNCILKIYDRERTVCDFFRMRLQLGEDVALEVLKSYMAASKNLQKLYEYAEDMKIKGIIKPYVEALV